MYIKSSETKISRTKEKSEINYYKEQFEPNENDIRKSWKVIKDVIGKNDNDLDDFYINSKLTIDKKTNCK